ncbi:MAG: helix-turn-helix domain-containing protein [Clostridia bacterium]|nr:helix-turn-helix domain-containing protein [Clostridia bacterium]
MNADMLAPFVRYIHYIEPQYMYNSRTRLGYDHRIFLCESGHIKITVDENVYELKQNSILYVPSGRVYILGANDNTAKLIGINFDFTYDHADCSTPISPAISQSGFDLSKQLEVAEFSDLKHFENPFVIHGQSELGAMIYRILDEFNTARIYHSQTESAMLKQVLLLATRVLTLGADKAPQRTVNVVIAYVHEHYMEPISNTDIGQALNFHPNYLNRLMLKHTGRSLHQYLLYYRLTKALDRLQSTTLSVAEIAERSGFADTGHFTEAFKKQFGSSPKEMRGRII